MYDAVRKGMGIKEVTELPHYMIKDMLNEGVLTEGVYDQGIFKAVFLMGGLGSGKSTVVDKLALPTLGLKLVNTDGAFENGLKKGGMSLDLRKDLMMTMHLSEQRQRRLQVNKWVHISTED